MARGESVSKWHELIADTIRLMPAGEPVDSERNRELAKRYLDLDMEQDTARTEQNFILMENIAPHAAATDRSTSCAKRCSTTWKPRRLLSLKPRSGRVGRDLGAVRAPQTSSLLPPFAHPHGTSYPRPISATTAAPSRRRRRNKERIRPCSCHG